MQFVNAKINIGLQIVRRRPDGYHDLQTVFYPAGIHAGTATDPERFCDLIEARLTDSPGVSLKTIGRHIACPVEKNLVYRAARLFLSEAFTGERETVGTEVTLVKNLPDGAGMGGGSADATFTLLELKRLFLQNGLPVPPEEKMASLALQLGADCPFFLLNRPAYAEGIGERLSPMPDFLAGHKLLIVKPRVYVSTREAFARVTPRPAEFDLRLLPETPVEEWRGKVCNDFELSIFPDHPELSALKDELYASGVLYASMTGSGSAFFGIFRHAGDAEAARDHFLSMPTIEAVYLLEA